jgi:hypothetical protein
MHAYVVVEYGPLQSPLWTMGFVGNVETQQQQQQQQQQQRAFVPLWCKISAQQSGHI